MCRSNLDANWDVAAQCAQLVCWGREATRLQNAATACGLDAKMLLVMRGTLETQSEGPIAERFLQSLGLAVGSDGFDAARRLVAAGGPSEATAPRRVLAGTVTNALSGRCFDIALSRDRSRTMPEAFSILLTANKRKLGYALVRVDPGGRLVFRGAFVASEARGSGLAGVLLSSFTGLAHELGAKALETDVIDKPVLALALTSRGFYPLDTRWAVWVKVLADGASIIWADDPNRDPASIFSHKFCRTQRIKLAPRESKPDSDARFAYVKTAFTFSLDRAKRVSHTRLSGGSNVQVDFFAARLLAFAYHACPSLIVN